MGAIGAEVGNWPPADSPVGAQPIREVLAELQAVVANAPIVLFAFNSLGIVTFSDGRSSRDLGMRPESHVGRSIYDLFPNTALAEKAARVLKGETCTSFTFLPEFNRSFETTYSPVFDEAGQVTGAIGVSIDVSARIEADRARAENEAKSRFLAGMSHELRTPLNSVLGFAQLLEQPSFGELNERQRRYVGHILDGGRHLLDLLNDILDLSRIAAGKLELQAEAVRLQPLVDSVVADMAPLAAGAEVTITIGPLDCTVLADRRATHQIVVNLLSNAIKFTPAGGRIEIRAATGDGFSGLSVTDSGPGIPADFLPHLFEEFVQFDSSRTGDRRGSGLGLSLSRGLAESMGGRLTVESEGGCGSTFQLLLPDRS